MCIVTFICPQTDTHAHKSLDKIQKLKSLAQNSEHSFVSSSFYRAAIWHNLCDNSEP